MKMLQMLQLLSLLVIIGISSSHAIAPIDKVSNKISNINNSYRDITQQVPITGKYSQKLTPQGVFIPDVTSASPNIVSIAGGTLVTLTGDGFVDHDGLYFYVEFGSNMFPSIITPTYVVVEVPAQVGTKRVPMMIWACAESFSPCTETSWYTSMVGITYSAPVITSVSPPDWCASGGTSLTVTGNYFGNTAGFYTSAYVKSTSTGSVAKYITPTITSISPTQIITGHVPTSSVTLVIENFTLNWSGGSVTIANVGGYTASC